MNRDALRYFSNYFIYSEDRYIAWLLLLGSILTIIATVALTVAFTWWSAAFMQILIAKNLPLLIQNIKVFLLLVGSGSKFNWLIDHKKYVQKIAIILNQIR